MRYILFSIAVVLFICCSGKKQDSQQATSSSDTLAPKSERVMEYESGYKSTVELDTLIDIDGKKYRIKLKHYCLFDNALKIPKTYNGSEFQTHNYAIDLNISVDGKSLIEKKIVKEDFKDAVNKELQNFGVILYPNFEGFKADEKAFVFEFSLSVPVTDIGVPVSFLVNTEGVFSVKKLR